MSYSERDYSEIIEEVEGELMALLGDPGTVDLSGMPGGEIFEELQKELEDDRPSVDGDYIKRYVDRGMPLMISNSERFLKQESDKSSNPDVAVDIETDNELQDALEELNMIYEEDNDVVYFWQPDASVQYI